MMSHPPRQADAPALEPRTPTVLILRSALTCVLLATLLVSISGCASAPLDKPIDVGAGETGPGSLVAARKFLEGRWALESFEIHSPGKPPITLKGSGALTYDEYSNLRMEIRADQAASNELRAAGIDIRDGTISQNGRTAVDMQNRTLTYFIEGQEAGTGPLALNRPRHWQVDGDVLTLTTKDDSGNALSVSRWKKTP
jgi:hypothetical protein